MFPAIPWLSSIILLPFIATIVLFSIQGSKEQVAKNARFVALWASCVTFLMSLHLMLKFDATKEGLQFSESFQWLFVQMNYGLGLDGISLPFVVLSTFLTILAILISWDAITENVREYMAFFLVLESLIVGMFCATDLLLFYIFFEALLIPMFFIIGIWGGERRIYATLKFFLYTFLGSVFLLLAILYIFFQTNTFDIEQLSTYHFSYQDQLWLWLAFFVAFAVKVPMWPLHTWLPDAHVEAPTAGSVLLAGILLKAGGYGFLRFSLPFFPMASQFFAPLVLTLSVIAILYASCIALVQKDIKKLIAYSSVAHMGFVTLGLFAMTPTAVTGSLFQMISHGIISGGLFLCIGMIYERFHTRDMALLGGLVQKMPGYAFSLMIFILGSVGLPGTIGFVGEFLVILGTFQVEPFYAAIASLGMVLGAFYSLWFYRKVIFGAESSFSLSALRDLKYREISILAIPIILVIYLGLYPKPLLEMIEPSVLKVLKVMKEKTISQEKQEQWSCSLDLSNDKRRH